MMHLISDPQVEQVIIDAWQNGWHGNDIGTVEYGPGHYIFEEIDDSYYVAQTISTGAVYVYAFPSREDSDAFFDEVCAIYEQIDARDESDV